MAEQRVVDYKVVARRSHEIGHQAVVSNDRIRRISSKNGSDPNKFLKDFLEIIDVLTLPVGYVEANCEWMLKEYYRTNGAQGWSRQQVFDFLLKLKRKPSFVLEFVTGIELEWKQKKEEMKKT